PRRAFAGRVVVALRNAPTDRRRAVRPRGSRLAVLSRADSRVARPAAAHRHQRIAVPRAGAGTLSPGVSIVNRRALGDRANAAEPRRSRADGAGGGVPSDA